MGKGLLVNSSLTPLLPCAAGHAGHRGGTGTRQALLGCVLGRALGRVLSLHAVVEVHQLLPQQVGSCHHTVHLYVSTEGDACKDLFDAAEDVLLAAERMCQMVNQTSWKCKQGIRFASCHKACGVDEQLELDCALL